MTESSECSKCYNGPGYKSPRFNLLKISFNKYKLPFV